MLPTTYYELPLLMPYDILPFLIMIIGFVLLGAVIVRKFPEIISLDVDRMPQEQQRKVKKRILKDRLERGFDVQLHGVMRVARPLWHRIKRSFYALYEKIVHVERVRRHKRSKEKLEPKSKDIIHSKVQQLLDKGRAYRKEGELDKAEDAYIEVLGIDRSLKEVYRELGEIYEEKKEYAHAKETYEHLLKLTEGEDPGAYFHLGEVQKKLGNFAEAKKDFEEVVDTERYQVRALADLADVCRKLNETQECVRYLKKLVTLEPNNPHYLDELIEISILEKDYKTALNGYRTLEKVNPENQKLPELKEKIETLGSNKPL